MSDPDDFEPRRLTLNVRRVSFDPSTATVRVGRVRAPGIGSGMRSTCEASDPERVPNAWKFVHRAYERALAAERTSSHVQSLIRGRPCGSPSERSRASIDPQPAYRDRLHVALGEQLVEGPVGRRRGHGPARASSSRSSMVSTASFLFVPMTPVGPRLIHPATYSPLDRLALLVEDTARRVRDRPALLVERHARKGRAAVADAPEHDPARDHLVLVGRNRPHAPGAVGLEAVAHDLDALHLVLAKDRDRRDAKSEPHAAQLPLRHAPGELPQDLEVALDEVRRPLQLGLARRIQLELGRVDDDVRASQLAHLAELGGRPRRLHRPAAPENDDLADPRADDRLDRRVRRVGRPDPPA